VSRFTRTFDRLKAEGRTGLVTYITAGDPSLARTRELLPALVRAGADVLEIGVPFSEPLADGPVIQRATERALKAGATLDKVLTIVEEVRPSIDVPLVLFTYVNPVVAIVLGMIVLGEQVTVGLIIGFPLVIAGCWLAATGGRFRSRDTLGDLPPLATD